MTTVGKIKANYFIYPGLSTNSSYSLLEIICQYMNTKSEDVKSDSRKRMDVLSRAYYFYINKRILKNKSLSELGRDMNDRDHSTVLHSLNTFQNDLHTDEEISEQFENFLKQTNKDWYEKYTHNRLA